MEGFQELNCMSSPVICLWTRSLILKTILCAVVCILALGFGKQSWVCYQFNLKPRPHNFKLPEKDNINFISRILFKR